MNSHRSSPLSSRSLEERLGAQAKACTDCMIFGATPCGHPLLILHWINGRKPRESPCVGQGSRAGVE